MAQDAVLAVAANAAVPVVHAVLAVQVALHAEVKAVHAAVSAADAKADVVRLKKSLTQTALKKSCTSIAALKW